MIKAIFFDLDGTLLNRERTLELFVEYQYNQFISPLEVVSKDDYITKFIELDDRGYVWKDKVYQQLMKHFNISALTWQSLLKDYLNNFKDCCTPFPGLMQTIKNLKSNNLVLGIITNGRGQFQMDNIKALGIEDYFDTILISEWEGMKKPDERLFRKALDRHHLSAGECIFVGDHPDKDIKASNHIGMISVWKEDCYYGKADADFIIKDLVEIIDIIDKINP
ncbi:HAD family hydrolase [Filobacillus milosensis]|uniref:HAD family hydrolase n=1 Tax=Filobacillus milosensis TaxID=94137 RepID=A0A4Y8ITC9_9BACI|nr:HAD-IA family hydrolase [Filobacillus milosensis]TFB24047.1 HAD family hydrolase [Filobacillus milosensis]